MPSLAFSRPALIVAMLAATPCVASDYPIAGLTPNQRPAGAPTIVVFKPGPDWEKNMFFGISQPLPGGLGWVSDQGAWYTPFNRPGMAPPYDPRGWRKSEGAK